jgi:hypothetical protein
LTVPLLPRGLGAAEATLGSSSAIPIRAVAAVAASLPAFAIDTDIPPGEIGLICSSRKLEWRVLWNPASA